MGVAPVATILEGFPPSTTPTGICEIEMCRDINSVEKSWLRAERRTDVVRASVLRVWHHGRDLGEALGQKEYLKMTQELVKAQEELVQKQSTQQ